MDGQLTDGWTTPPQSCGGGGGGGGYKNDDPKMELYRLYRKMTINSHFFIQSVHGCLANVVFILVPSNSVIKMLWFIKYRKYWGRGGWWGYFFFFFSREQVSVMHSISPESKCTEGFFFSCKIVHAGREPTNRQYRTVESWLFHASNCCRKV